LRTQAGKIQMIFHILRQLKRFKVGNECATGRGACLVATDVAEEPATL